MESIRQEFYDCSFLDSLTANSSAGSSFFRTQEISGLGDVGQGLSPTSSEDENAKIWRPMLAQSIGSAQMSNTKHDSAAFEAPVLPHNALGMTDLYLQAEPRLCQSNDWEAPWPGPSIETQLIEYLLSNPHLLSLAAPAEESKTASLLHKAAGPAPAEQPTNPSPGSLYKTELCRSWCNNSTCRYGNKCQFAHGYGELRPVRRHPKYKTEMCRTFAKTGECPYGIRCRFIHGSAPPTPLTQPVCSHLFTAPPHLTQPLPTSFRSGLGGSNALDAFTPNKSVHEVTGRSGSQGGLGIFHELESPLQHLTQCSLDPQLLFPALTSAELNHSLHNNSITCLLAEAGAHQNLYLPTLNVTSTQNVQLTGGGLNNRHSALLQESPCQQRLGWSVAQPLNSA